jgi:hypothetical protein
MASKLKPDVLQALQDWKAGKPVHSVELGHVHRMKETPGGASPQVDFSVRLHNDQERAHAYCFDILERISGMTQPPPDHDTFLNGWCIAAAWRKHRMDGGLTLEEALGAESLAWKALMIGWNRAIASHDPSRYIDVTNTEVVCAT